MECRKWVLVLYLFFLLVQLQTGNSTSQQELDQVFKLPGQTFNVSFAQYAGYVTVNEESGRTLFYRFIEAVEDPSTKPILLWLEGVVLGPGCSSIAYGEAELIGPFHIKPDGKTLFLNPYSWNQVANIIFLDSPVGVGFSYSNNSKDILNNGDKRTAEDSLVFLLKWFERFPQYIGKDFYISGQSYTGHFAPQLSQAIVRHQKATNDKTINLKGYMVGNALTHDFTDHKGSFQYMWSVGLISDQTYKLLNHFCNVDPFVHPSSQCNNTLNIAFKEIGNIDIYSIYTPPCSGNVKKRPFKFGPNGEKGDPCLDAHTTAYFNLPEVQKAIHVKPEVAPSQWTTCSLTIRNNWKDSPTSMLDIYRELMALGLRIWMFSGDTDVVIPVASTRMAIDILKLPTVSPWHAWYDNGQVGGWTQQYEGLTYVTMRGAGHTVPLHRPKLSLALIKAFLSGSQMPTNSTY